MAHTIQLQEETQPETAPAKTKGKSASQATASDFSQFVGQFLGAVVQNTQQTGQEVSADAGPHCVAAQPAPQPGPQPAADAFVTLPQNAAMFLGVKGPDALAVEGAKTADPSIAAPGSKDNAGLTETSGNEDALIPVANDNPSEKDAVGTDHKPAHIAGDATKQGKSDLHKLLAKQDSSGIVTDERKTGEPADRGRSSALPTGGDFPTVMHQESSGVQNVRALISGATITHRTDEGSGSVPLRSVNAADALNTTSAIVKDGNRLAVKFEQNGLGKLDIDLRLNKGIINAQIQVADDTTKVLIENNMQQIVDSLLKAGLTVGGFSVSLKGGGQQNGTPEEQYGYSTEGAARVTGESAGIAQHAAANGLVSIFI